MHLLILAVIAFLIGYLLAGSKYSKSIDDASGKVTKTSKDWAGKVSETSKSWVDKVGDWWSGLFKTSQPAKSQVVDMPKSPSPEQIQAAEKRPSRRKSEDEAEASE
jgi:hypothetical protein